MFQWPFKFPKKPAKFIEFQFRQLLHLNTSLENVSHSDIWKVLSSLLCWCNFLFYQYLAKKPGLLTIETKDPNYQDIIGWTYGLTFYDMKLANIIYNCNCKFIFLFDWSKIFAENTYKSVLQCK